MRLGGVDHTLGTVSEIKNANRVLVGLMPEVLQFVPRQDEPSSFPILNG